MTTGSGFNLMDKLFQRDYTPLFVHEDHHLCSHLPPFC